jgi:hypothetical protein
MHLQETFDDRRKGRNVMERLVGPASNFIASRFASLRLQGSIVPQHYESLLQEHGTTVFPSHDIP